MQNDLYTEHVDESVGSSKPINNLYLLLLISFKEDVVYYE